MPILAIIYAIFISFVAIATVYDNFKNREQFWKIFVTSVSDFVVLAFFVGYWIPDLVRGIGPAALLLFLLAVGWDLRNFRTHPTDFSDPEYSPEMNEHYYRFVLGLSLILSFPAYWFGAIAAWRCLSS